MFLISVFLLSTGRAKGYDFSQSSSKTEERDGYVITDQVVKYYDFSFFLGLGIAFLLITLYAYWTFFLKTKKAYFKQLNRDITRHKKTGQEILIKIDDEEFFYKDTEIQWTGKWTIFLKYKLYKEYLILFRDEGDLSSFVLSKSQMSESDFNELIGFLKKNLVSAT